MQDILVFITSHIALVAAFIIIVILLGILEFIKIRYAAAQLSTTQATQLINHENAVVVDIRTTDAYKQSHVLNAISIPAAELKKNPQKLNKYRNQPIILSCASGMDSPKTADLLKNLGFRIYVLAGGFRNWKDTGLPITKENS